MHIEVLYTKFGMVDIDTIQTCDTLPVRQDKINV